jgi:CheY-like chemotaxis protein
MNGSHDTGSRRICAAHSSYAWPVLIVDDDRDISGIVAEILSAEGFVVSELGDAHPAIIQAEVTRLEPDVVLLDGGEGSGYGHSWVNAAWMRERTRPIPVIMFYGAYPRDRRSANRSERAQQEGGVCRFSIQALQHPRPGRHRGPHCRRARGGARPCLGWSAANLIVASDPQSAGDTRGRVSSIVEAELARVDTLEDAEAVIRRAEDLAAAQTEAQAGKQAASGPASAPTEVEAAERAAPSQQVGAADALVETAAQAVAPTPEATAVLQGAQEAIGADHDAQPSPPRVRRGRSLLRQAVLRRMGPFQALDARLYLEVNGQARPRLLDEVCRRRPFIDVVRALVVGKEPGSWSFPSRHTCAAFAAAWTLSRYWPRLRPLFFGVAATLGYSRVFVGAHYPGDVATGAVLGMALSELVRRATLRAGRPTLW